MKMRTTRQGLNHSLSSGQMDMIENVLEFELNGHRVIAPLTEMEWDLIEWYRKERSPESIRRKVINVGELIVDLLDTFGEQIYAAGMLKGKEDS